MRADGSGGAFDARSMPNWPQSHSHLSLGGYLGIVWNILQLEANQPPSQKSLWNGFQQDDGFPWFFGPWNGEIMLYHGFENESKWGSFLEDDEFRMKQEQWEAKQWEGRMGLEGNGMKRDLGQLVKMFDLWVRIWEKGIFL